MPALDHPKPTSAPAVRASTNTAYPPTTIRELDLLGGSSYVATGFVYNGFSNQTNTTYPVLLNRSTASAFWPSNQSVLLLAPHLTTGHDAGMFLFPGTTNLTETISAVGAMSPHRSGDGFEAYFGVTPASTASWNSQYFATYPEWTQGNTAPCQGSVIFPYSSTPYVVVQWEAAYYYGGCNGASPYGKYYSGDFNVYLVASGTVTKAQIGTLPGLGGLSTQGISGRDYLNFRASYSEITSTVEASVVDLNNSAVLEQATLNLSGQGFSLGETPGSSTYYGLGGSGNGGAGWALLNATLTLGGSFPLLPGYFVNFDASQNPTQSPPWWGGGWAMNFNGSYRFTNLNEITYVEANGSFQWSLSGSVYKYTAVPDSGTLLVSGGSVTEVISYLGGNPTVSHASFAALGLSNGSGWSVSLGSTIQSSLTNSLTIAVVNGSYTYSVVAPPGFSASPSSGPVSVTGSNPTLVNVTFSALAIPTYNVTVLTQPNSCSVQFYGTTVPSGTTVKQVPAGGQTMVALSCFGVAFVSWSATAGVILAPYSFDSSIDVQRNGSLTATFATPTGPSIHSFSASPASIPVGQTTQINVSVTGGVPPYVFQYSNLPPGCFSVDSATFSCIPTGAGSYSLLVTIQDSNGFDASSSAPLSVTSSSVGSLTVSSFTAAPSSVSVGTASTISTSVSGGTSTYTYSYSGLPPGACLSANQSSINCVPSASGSFQIQLHVRDSAGASGSGSALLQVSPLATSGGPTLGGFSIAPSTNTLGQPITLDFVSSGWPATPSFSYTGLPPGCASTDASSYSCVPTSAGSYAVTATVTDSSSHTLTALADVQIEPSSLPSIQSFTANPYTVDEGQSIAFSVVVTGGVSPYTYNYVAYGGGNACGSGISASSGTSTCVTIGMQGTFRLSVYVTDQGYHSSSVAWVTFTVVAPTQNWINDPSFHVVTVPISSQSVCGTGLIFDPVQLAACASLSALFKGDGSAGATVYVIAPNSLTPSAVQGFDSSLSSYFGISPGAPYTPVITLVLHIPIIEDANAIFGTSLPTHIGAPISVPLLGGIQLAGFNPTVVLTADGAINFAFTLSDTSPFTFVDIASLGGGLAALIAELLGALLKPTDATTIVSLINDGVGVFLQTADITVTSISSDLTAQGPLSSLTFFDVAAFYNAPWREIVIQLLHQLQLLIECGLVGATSGLDARADIGCPLTAIDDAVALLPKALPGWNLDTNPAYILFSSALDSVTSIVDPPKSTILPTIRDYSGKVVLGYDPRHRSFTSASRVGMLIYMGNSISFHISTRNQSGANYTLEFTEVGNISKGAFLPYSGQVFVGSPRGGNFSKGFAGILLNGTSTNASLKVSQGTNVSIGRILRPTVNVSLGAAGTYNVSIDADTINGTTVAPQRCILVRANFTRTLVIKGDDCSGTLPRSAASHVYAAYVYTPSYAGGYLAVRIPPVLFNVTLTSAGLPNGAAWSVSLNGVLRSSTGSSVSFREPNGTYAYLVKGPSGHRVTGILPAGNLTVIGTKFLINGARPAPIHFVSGTTGVVRFLRSGLPNGSIWCVGLGGTSCGTKSVLSFGNLTPGVYPYAVHVVIGYIATVMSAGHRLGLVGWLRLPGAWLNVTVSFTKAPPLQGATMVGTTPCDGSRQFVRTWECQARENPAQARVRTPIC
jgi:hypothetical protein